LFLESFRILSLKGFKDYVPNIRTYRDARQLNLNFYFGETRLINSEDGNSNMNDAVDAVDGEHRTLDSNEVIMLLNPS
jgi:hypothetical protein